MERSISVRSGQNICGSILKNWFIAVHFSSVDFTCVGNSEIELKMVRPIMSIPLSWPG